MSENTTVPSHYDLCIVGECPKASTCLRHVALQLTESKRINILNPRMMTTTGDCPHYAKAEKVPYAKGFKNVMGKLPFNVHERAANALMSAFSERTYYRIRKGERLLSPDEQQCIRRILNRLGYTEPCEFDEYVEDYLW